jgi:hypothetical protein
MPQVIARSLAAWDNSLQKVPVSFLNIRDEVSVLMQRNYEQLLPRVPTQIVMFQNFQKAALPNGDNDLLKRDTPLALQPLVLGRIPTKCLHTSIIVQRVPIVITQSFAVPPRVATGTHSAI